jgi:hypothetical protein
VIRPEDFNFPAATVVPKPAPIKHRRKRKRAKNKRFIPRSPVWFKLFKHFDPLIKKVGPFPTNHAAATAAFLWLRKTGIAFRTLERGIPQCRAWWVDTEAKG